MTSRQKFVIGALVVINVVIIAVVFFLLQPNADSNDLASDTDDSVVVDVAETPELEDNATEAVDPAETAEPAVTIEVSSVSTSNNVPPNFDLAVTYGTVYTDASENVPVSLGAPPDGFNWVMVTGSLFNNDPSDAIYIDADHLILTTDAGEEYIAEAPNGAINPYLVETELLAGENIYGFVVYAIPETATAATLQWCPLGECSSPLEVAIALQD